jgi:hypothetical protein
VAPKLTDALPDPEKRLQENGRQADPPGVLGLHSPHLPGRVECLSREAISWLPGNRIESLPILSCTFRA